jgi:ferredoxin
MEKTIKVRLKFDANSASQPMIYYFAKNFDIVFSILQADIRPGTGGRTIMEITGEEANIERSLDFARERGVDVKILSKAVVWNEKTCVHCGACTAVCQPKALSLDAATAELSFNNASCVVCEMCIGACPTGSIRVDLYE